MAKKPTSTIMVGSDTLQVTTDLRNTINAVRPKLMGFSEGYAAISVKKAQIAEPFMDGFALFNKETGRSFVDYVRAIDPKVPADREGYRNHTTYQAADYLRRSVTLSNRAGGANGERRVSPTRTNAVGRMARLLGTILKHVKESEHDAIWTALSDELALTPRQVTNLKAAVTNTQPLFELAGKPVHAEIVQLEPMKKAA